MEFFFEKVKKKHQIGRVGKISLEKVKKSFRFAFL